MVNNTNSLDLTFAALSDLTRRRILERLIAGEATVSDVAEPFPMTLPAISKHLRVLEAAGLITRRREGRLHYLRLNPQPVKEALEWLAFYQQFWNAQLDSLADYFREQHDEQP